MSVRYYTIVSDENHYNYIDKTLSKDGRIIVGWSSIEYYMESHTDVVVYYDDDYKYQGFDTLDDAIGGYYVKATRRDILQDIVPKELFEL